MYSNYELNLSCTLNREYLVKIESPEGAKSTFYEAGHLKKKYGALSSERNNSKSNRLYS